ASLSRTIAVVRLKLAGIDVLEQAVAVQPPNEVVFIARTMRGEVYPLIVSPDVVAEWTARGDAWSAGNRSGVGDRRCWPRASGGRRWRRTSGEGRESEGR